MITLIIESEHDSVFNFNNPSFVKDFSYDEKVGKVSAHDYQRFEKRKEGNIEYMTGNDYIEKCAKDIFKNTIDYVLAPVDKNVVNDYAIAMKSGSRFPICYLDYVYEQQEGRHRALAFEKAFGIDAKMPVLVIKPASADIEEIADYCQRKWGGYWDSFFTSMASNFGYSNKEINNFLGYDYTEDEDTFEKNDDFEVNWDDLDIDEDDLDL